MLRRRHRKILSSMNDLSSELKVAEDKVYDRAPKPVTQRQRTMILSKFNANASLDTDLLSRKLEGLCKPKLKKKTKDPFAASKRDQPLSMLPPMTRDGSFLVNQLYD